MSNLTVRRFLTVAFLLLLLAVLLLKSVEGPLPTPPPAVESLSWSPAAHEIPQDLEPADDLFSSLNEPEPYDLALRAALLPPRGYLRCQLVAIPSFEPEWAIYLTREEGSAPRLGSRRLGSHLWAEMTSRISDNGRRGGYSLGPEAQTAALAELKIEVETSQAVVAVETADVLETVWSRMLEGVHYPGTPWGGEDGVRYRASHWSRGLGFRSGQTWSPRDESRPHALVKLAEQMAAFAHRPSREAELRLQEAADALLHRLK